MIGISIDIGLINTLGRTQELLAVSAQRLATGQRINRGSDDPAGLIASENLEAQLAALEAESRALERNDAVARTAEAALAEVNGMLAEGEGLAVAAANTGAMSDAERAAIQLEMDSINQSAERTLRTASFGGTPLFNGELSIPGGSGGGSLDLGMLSVNTLGATDFGGEVFAQRDTSSGEALALNGGRPGDAQVVLSSSRREIATLRGSIGSFQRNGLGPRIAAIGTEFINVADANSLIRDTDYGAELVNLARLQTLEDSARTMLALGNQRPENVFIALGLNSRRL
jgi:flagellin-like hook-associated protein FlgL